MQRVLMPGSGAESWTLLGDDGEVVGTSRYLPGLPGRHRAVAEHRAGLRRQLEAVVRVPGLGQGRLGWRWASRTWPASWPGYYLPRRPTWWVLADGAAVRRPATVNRYLAGVFGFYDHHARAGLGVAAELVAWRLGCCGSGQTVLAPCDLGEAHPGVAGEAARPSRQAPRTLATRANCRRPGRHRAPEGTGSCCLCWQKQA